MRQKAKRTTSKLGVFYNALRGLYRMFLRSTYVYRQRCLLQKRGFYQSFACQMWLLKRRRNDLQYHLQTTRYLVLGLHYHHLEEKTLLLHSVKHFLNNPQVFPLDLPILNQVYPNYNVQTYNLQHSL